MPHEPHALVLAALIILLSYFIRGVSGFGSGLVAVPLLAHLAPLTFVVPMVLVTDFTASLVLSTQTRRDARWDELASLLPFGLLGVVLGTTLLLRAPRTPLLFALGCFVLVFGIRGVLRLGSVTPISRWWGVPAGLLAGTVGALFGTGGPPYVIYLGHRMSEKGEMRATLSALFLVEGAVRIVTFLLTGLLGGVELALAIGAALPLVALGLWLGHRVHHRLSSTHMQRVVGLLLVVSGVALILRALV